MGTQATGIYAHRTAKLFFLMCLGIFLTACQSTSSSRDEPLLVGPQPIEAQGINSRALQNANVFLDVAIPVFEPGFPIDKRSGEIDYEHLDEEGIWPQLRRTEAKLFALETKKR